MDLANIGGVDPFIGKFAGMAANEGWTFGAVAAAMAEPQRFEDDDIVYRPCQMFAEFAKSCGCDGISYPSALARGGTNVVFFDPDIAEIKSSQLVQITAVRYWHRDMPTLPPDSSSSAVEDSGQST